MIDLKRKDEFVEIYSDEEGEREMIQRCLLINNRMDKCVRCPDQIKQIERKGRIWSSFFIVMVTQKIQIENDE